MKPKIYDISPLISPRLAVFPGDQAFSRKVALDYAKGDHLVLSSLTMTSHLGAHADAPSHYHPRGETLEKRPLSPYLGCAQVVRVLDLKPSERIMPQHLKTKEN